MTEIILKPADNGVIKTVKNSKWGGSNELVETVNVYEYKNTEDKFIFIKKFIFELCEDLLIETGNKFDKKVLSIDTTWGSSYKPSRKDIDTRISELEAEINLLREWKKA